MALSVRCLQFLLVIFDGIFFITGFSVIVLNCIFLYRMLILHTFLDIEIVLPCILMIVIGFVSLFFSWVGWKSAWNLHRMHLILFGICLMLVVLAEIGFSIWSLVVWNNMRDQISDAIEVDFKSVLNKTEDEDFIKRWAKVQTELQCCGVGGPNDYRAREIIPWSCCVRTSALSAHIPDCATFYQRGCLEPIIQSSREAVLYVCLTALAAGLIQSIGLVCAYYLQAAISRPPASSVWVSPEEPSTSGRRPAPQPPRNFSATKALLASEQAY